MFRFSLCLFGNCEALGKGLSILSELVLLLLLFCGRCEAPRKELSIPYISILLLCITKYFRNAVKKQKSNYISEQASKQFKSLHHHRQIPLHLYQQLRSPPMLDHRLLCWKLTQFDQFWDLCRQGLHPLLVDEAASSWRPRQLHYSIAVIATRVEWLMAFVSATQRGTFRSLPDHV